MKIFLTAMVVLLGLPLGLRAAQGSAAGDYLELHSCELFAGGCTVSAQATQGGRSLLRLWHFSENPVAGLPVGATVAVLETAEANLAQSGTAPISAVAYLPEGLTSGQQDLLKTWLEQTGEVIIAETRVVPISYKRDGSRVSFEAGDAIAFATRAMETCDAGGCGEQLWYEPRGKTGPYTVLVNEHSAISEPYLRLSWKDHSSRSVFFGKFGTSGLPQFSLAAIP